MKIYIIIIIIINPAICDQNFELVLAAMYKPLGKTEQHLRG